MSAIPESSAEAVLNDYDSFAEAYVAENETSLFNAYYTRPAVVELAGDVAGRRILDAGCGAGPIFSDLRDRGAVVSGFDSSAEMVRIGREKLGPDADIRVADITQPLPYADAEFDDVVSALVLQYFEDWTTPLAELRRVLKPGGRLILVVNHPMIYKLAFPDTNYFDTTQWSDEYTFAGRPAVLTYWHRPLSAMSDAFAAAGFRTAHIAEPYPAPEAYELHADQLKGHKRFICFIFFVLESGLTAALLRGSSI
ncbi:class I SAM-dependent methyltransferase [Kutzneria sp. 744]|uniref:class I SAM-dependent methyltransferase n=1 Tax=Kutzneria sp. (strain 744) TaxID=345341 RepID=UPI0003EECCFF|nr:class I SAM-dependent methyltransferase [Kutzneria sp. 744]EWM10512.1 methyltransferase [Kutzneria sp. 744]